MIMGINVPVGVNMSDLLLYGRKVIVRESYEAELCAVKREERVGGRGK